MPVSGVSQHVSVSYRGSARHRADQPPSLAPVAPARPAHIDRRRQLARGIPAVIGLALAMIVGSRLLLDDPGASEPGAATAPTAPTAPAVVPGSRVDVSLDAAGNVRVTVDVTWPGSPETLSLSVPASTAYGLRPRVVISLIEADGVPVHPQVTLAAGQDTDIPLEAGVTRTRLEYTGTGTHVASTPSVPGRGLVLLTPLRVADAGVDLRLDVTDARILNLACRTADQTRACGTRSGSTWTVTDLAAGEDVVAQVDLAAPTS